jgi:hypothetical protein
MDKYYLTLDKSINQPISQTISQINQPIKHSPKQLTTIKSSEINKSPSPKTLRKNISNENFIKFQWPWLL